MVNPEVLSKSLNQFARDNKMNQNDYESLKGRRNSIIDLIKIYSKNYELTIVEKFNVGSYKIKTGVQRDGKEGWAFDIDYVIVFSEEFNYEHFKNNLTSWLRKEVKKKYAWNVIVSNKKKVVSIAFRNRSNEKTLFYLDIALYVKKENELHHIKRDEQEEYYLEKGKPKDTYTRQKNALANNESKRNAIILLKYLKEKNRIKGTSSICITDNIIDYDDNLDTFSLMHKFIQSNKNTNSFFLKEMPYSELIKDSFKFNSSLQEMYDKFFSKETTTEVYEAMNSWFDWKLPELEKDLMEDRNERYSGG